ncbi:hypothetical protein [Actinoplanes sp. NPDC049802]|uniref:hypothetical protein n=1 Tax=Actinoplanes sp. NPDC049802 TaxID=3154742 RepID=UPI003405C35C
MTVADTTATPIAPWPSSVDQMQSELEIQGPPAPEGNPPDSSAGIVNLFMFFGSILWGRRTSVTRLAGR